MLPLRLYIKDFCCYSESSIDFSKFSYALITGSVENKKESSNGIGKSVIFKSIEYVLFNECEFPLERIIRDDQESCKVIFDFESNSTIYRVARSRNKKGNSDLSLLKLKNECEDAFSFDINVYKKHWEDLSSRRTGDTEKDLSNLIKINYTSFRSTVHFLQEDDKSGLASLTPTKRKGLLKESLNLAVYAKLEKVAKEKSSLLLKEIEKLKSQLEMFIDNSSKIPELQKIINENEQKYLVCLKQLEDLNKEAEKEFYFLNLSTEVLSNKEKLFESAKLNILSLEKDVENFNKNINSLTIRKKECATFAKNLTSKIDEIKNTLSQLSEIDLNQIKDKISSLENDLITNQSLLKQNEDLIKKLLIPLPNTSKCDYCRGDVSKEHLEKCQKEIDAQLVLSKKENLHLKELIKNINQKIYDEKIHLTNCQKNNELIKSLNNELIASKPLYEERKSLYNEYTQQLNELNLNLSNSLQKITDLKSSIIDIKTTQEYADFVVVKDRYSEIQNKIKSMPIQSMINESSIEKFQINQIKSDLEKRVSLLNQLNDLENKYKVYPYALQAFSSTGIPNFIVQNMLDDLQTEVNALLPSLHDGLQLSFITEKLKKEESQDTLDIIYYLNGRERVYEQLSGAQKLAATFSLKIGLMFVLQNILGQKFELLLLDEADHALDETSIDSYFDFIKKFSETFKVLVISHNPRLKEKCQNVINVQQDYNKVSRIL